MTPAEKRRLERLEAFVSALVLRSHIAKASDLGQRYLSGDVVDADVPLAVAVADHVATEARELLEQQVTPKPANPKGPTMTRTTLAKADDLGSLTTGAEILEIAQSSPRVDAVQLGIIDHHVQLGNLPAAARALAAAQNNTVAKADDVGSVTRPATTETPVDVERILGALSRLERQIGLLESRLSAVETRQRVPTLAVPQTVAKAVGGGGKKPRTYNVQAMLADLDSYVDDPVRSGAISSMIQTGQLAEAAKLLLSAKRTHESERLKQERKSWQS